MKVILLGLSLLAAHGLWAQDDTHRGIVQRIKVHGRGLEGNLEGDSPDRDVAVHLPPGYFSSPARRYPVVYLLHGFTDDVDKWWGVKPHFVNVPDAANKALAAGGKEMILVMPDAFTRYQGSLYSSSVTTGDWENYVAKELVEYVDSHYRTIADPSGRGLAGHSMGGYGAIRIGMKHAGIYSSLYLLSPCCLTVGSLHPNPRAEAVHNPADVATLDFFSKALFAAAAAWSPDPKNPPFFLDLPYKNGELQPQVLAKWQANSPLAMIDQSVTNLRSYTAIGMDVGTEDRLIGTDVGMLDRVLESYGIRHIYETYQGDHVNRVAERLEKKVLPFFADNLK